MIFKKIPLTDIPKKLIETALKRWEEKKSPADNISVIVGFFNVTDTNCHIGKRPNLDIVEMPASKRLAQASL